MEHTVKSRWIDIEGTQGEKFSGYLSLPPSGSGPGIVLVQEIWGVNEHIRAVADQYALDGYVVLAPDVFWRLEPRVDLDYDEAGTAKAFELYQKVDTAQAAADVASALSTLRKMPEVTGKVATLGFCLGGQLAYRAAAIGQPDASVAYYGGGIDQHLDVADKITMPIMFHYAQQDSHIPQAAVQLVKERFAGKSNATFFDYPNTDHGFNCWGRSGMYNQRAAALAHGRTLQFLAQHL
jgi:carboxymethylenebutenolidase